MPNDFILVTGANGEIGHGLVGSLCDEHAERVIALDLKPLDPSLESLCHTFFQGDILDTELLKRIGGQFSIGTIHHLASILSSRAERHPETAHRVNVGGTLNLLQFAIEQAQARGRPIKFIYPSSIAVYGLPDLDTKERAGCVLEDQWCMPRTMYGCNKLYSEHLGRYYARHYRQLELDLDESPVDFRALRFPGLISSDTVPTGGTSDYGPEMLHAAARGSPYTCFVRPDTRLPFMAMPDAVKALLKLEATPRDRLSRLVYNVTSFSLSAEQIAKQILEFFPEAQIDFDPHPGRQAIVDSWPADVDDTAARKDWGWEPTYGLKESFTDYLVPAVVSRYRAQAASGQER